MTVYAVDISGGMTPEQHRLAKFFMDWQSEPEADVFCFDHSIHPAGKVCGFDPSRGLPGQGGTMLGPVWEMAAGYPVDRLVVLSDGFFHCGEDDYPRRPAGATLILTKTAETIVADVSEGNVMASFDKVAVMREDGILEVLRDDLA